MTIVVDGDACPVKDDIISIARAHRIPVVLVASIAHAMPDTADVEVVRVDREPQAADIAIANRARAGDIVVTGDYGLACMVLGRRARVVDFRGGRITEQNIEPLMARRHALQRIRRGGGRHRGPRAFSADDRTAFRAALEQLIIHGAEPV